MQSFNERLTNKSKFKRNSIFDNSGRFNSNNIKKFDFASGLKSKDIKNLNFINYANNENEEAYCIVKNLYYSCISEDYDFFNDLAIDELHPGYRLDRLLDIISIIQNKKYTINDMPYIFKTRYKKHDKLRIYVKQSRNNLSVVLIDLYHLGIFSKNYDNGKVKFIPIQKLYKYHSQNFIKLDDLKLREE